MNSKPTTELAKLRQICTAGLASEIVMPEALRALHGLVASDVNACHWCDAQGHHSASFVEDPMGWLREASPDHVASFERDTGIGFRQAMLFGKPVGNLRALTSGAAFERSESFRAICSPLGLRWMLDGVLRDATRPWGMVVLARTGEREDFSATDHAWLARALPYLLHAMQSPGGQTRAWRDCGRSGLLVFDAGGRLLESSERARELVLMAFSAAGAGERPELSWGDDEVAARLSALAGTLDAVRGVAPPPAATLRNRWGEFAFRAYRTDAGAGGASRMGVVIEHRVPVELEILRRIVDSPLSVRQKEVCWRVAQGADNARIAQELGVSHPTLKEYFGGIYQRLNVANREELVRRLLLLHDAAADGAPD